MPAACNASAVASVPVVDASEVFAPTWPGSMPAACNASAVLDANLFPGSIAAPAIADELSSCEESYSSVSSSSAEVLTGGAIAGSVT